MTGYSLDQLAGIAAQSDYPQAKDLATLVINKWVENVRLQKILIEVAELLVEQEAATRKIIFKLKEGLKGSNETEQNV